VLFLEVSLTIVRSRKPLVAPWKVTSEGTLAMDGIYVATEILVQGKSLSISAAGDSTPESTLVALGVLTLEVVSVRA
jgi:hypothetical protein